MTCKMCRERGKTWKGSDPVCYFDDPEHNWNCATVNEIRDIFTPDGWYVDPDNLPEGVTAIRVEDTTRGLIRVDEIFDRYEGEYVPWLYVQWYKRRGATERLLLLREGGTRRPTEKELLAIIEYYKGRKGQRND